MTLVWKALGNVVNQASDMMFPPVKTVRTEPGFAPKPGIQTPGRKLSRTPSSVQKKGFVTGHVWSESIKSNCCVLGHVVRLGGSCVLVL